MCVCNPRVLLRTGVPRARGSPVSARSVPPAHGAVLCSLRSARKGRSQQDPRARWLKAAILLLFLCAAAGGGLVVWSRVRTQDGIPEGGIPGDGIPEGGIPADGVTEVLAHRSDTLQDKFVEVPCSEDYESHKRFAGTGAGLAVLGGQQQLGPGTKLGLQNSRVCSKLLVTISCLKPQTFVPLGPAHKLILRGLFPF